MIDHISIVIITRNAASTLADTLDAVRDFDNVVVWDNGSTDDTMDIARRYENVDLHQGKFIGFGPSKNAACDLARHDWVLSIDSDEKPNAELIEALRQRDGKDPHVVGQVLRENHFMGRAVRRGGWGNDRLVRLFHRHTHQFNDAQVHEKVAIDSQTRVEDLPGRVEHAAVTEIGQFLQKIDRYTEIRRETQGRTYPAWIVVIKSAFAFFRSYILQLGFLAGWRGLVIAWSNANGVFYKYMKLLADRRVAREREASRS